MIATPLRRPTAEWAAATGLAIIYICHSLTVNYVVDDSFISFQYVKNALAGQGLVYNPGERVEGYTGFLWVALLTAAASIVRTVSVVDLARVLGVGFGVLTILLVCRFALNVAGRRGPLALLAGAFLAAHAGFAAWGTAGLETTLFAFLVFAGAYAYASFLKTGRHALLAPAIFAVASMTRPDGLLFFGLTWLHLLVMDAWQSRRLLPSRRALLCLAMFGAIYLPYFGWRFAYYGYPLPNTFYAKVGSGLYQYARGLRYLSDYVVTYGAVLALAPAALLLLRRKREAWRDYFLLLIAVYTLYIVYVGGDGLGFNRFVVYIAPLVYLLAQEGFGDLFGRLRVRNFHSTALARAAAGGLALAAVVSVGLSAQASLGPLLRPDHYRWYEPQSELSFPGDAAQNPYEWFDNYFVDRLATAARWFDQNAPAGAVVATTPAGAIAYYMHQPVIDMLGLNDLQIARSQGVWLGQPGLGRAGHEKGDGQYVLARQPDYILMGNVAVLARPITDEATMATKLVLKSEHELWDLPEFHRDYQLVCVRLADQPDFAYFSFFKRRDRELAPASSSCEPSR